MDSSFQITPILFFYTSVLINIYNFEETRRRPSNHDLKLGTGEGSQSSNQQELPSASSRWQIREVIVRTTRPWIIVH